MSIKSERVAQLIKNHLSHLFLTEIRDPRLEGVTITDIYLDRELEHAEIFVNALGDESREAEVMAGLRSASGYMRRELAARLRTRRTPQLHFKWDHVMQQAQHLEEVLDSLHIDDDQEAVDSGQNDNLDEDVNDNT